MKKIAECPAERATYFIGGKWKIRILFNLFYKKRVRFGELKKTLVKITQQMLSKQLKELEQDGLINREVKSVMPPKVEYSLTSFGFEGSSTFCSSTTGCSCTCSTISSTASAFFFLAII